MPLRLFPSLLALALPLVFLAACGPSTVVGRPVGERPPDMAVPKFDPTRDNDGDGYTMQKGDCDDRDQFTYPGAKEICGDNRDQNCTGIPDEHCDNDGDGYARLAGGMLPGGDCNDGDPFIGPGALESQTNGRDDNCNDVTDEPVPSCDVGLVGNDPLTYAKSIGVCAPWLKEASFNRLVEPTARRITNRFGTKFKPQSGETMALFSSGVAADTQDMGYQPPQPGWKFQRSEANPAAIDSKNVCTGGAARAPALVNDLVALKLTIQVPTNAKAFQFKLNFFSAEYPEYVGNQYNDMFVAYLESKAFKGNVSFDGNGEPVTVNSGFFTVCESSPICNNTPNPKTQGHRCSRSADELLATGYETFAGNGERYGGGTGWLTTSKRVTPGEVITLTLYVFDAGDFEWDSAVLLDGFQWLFDEAVEGTIPG